MNAKPYAALMSAPLLSREREHELVQRWQLHGDRLALSELIDAHTRLAVKAAAKLARVGFAGDDLIQEGLIGLIQAAKNFDCAKGVRFSTFAMFYVRAAIQQFLWLNSTPVPLPQSLPRRALFTRLRNERGVLDGPRLAAIAADMRAEIGEVQAMALRLAGGMIVSFDAPVAAPDGKSRTRFADVVVDAAPDPEACALALSDSIARRRTLAAALGQLTPKEAKVIQARWLGPDKRIFADVGAELGVSRERVRQLEESALTKLRRLLVDGQPLPAARPRGRPPKQDAATL